ncbi:MAG: hypothetical protein QXV75_07850 [Candidatus Bathyarchaeia archaeon]
MSVELRIVIPKRLFELLEKKAKDLELEVSDLIQIALTRVIEE